MGEVLDSGPPRTPPRRASWLLATVPVAVVAVAGFAALRADRDPVPRPSPSPTVEPRPIEYLALRGGFRTTTSGENYAYATYVRNMWRDGVGIHGVVPLDANGDPVPAIVAAVLPVGETPDELPATPPPPAIPYLSPVSEVVLVVRIAPDCAAPRVVTAFRLLFRAEGVEREQVLVPLADEARALAELPHDVCAR